MIVVTASGWIDLNHPAWKTDRKKLVATSKYGYEQLQKTLNSKLAPNSDTKSSDSEHVINKWLQSNQITLRAFESTVTDRDVDFQALARFLKSEWHIEYMDVSAGPTLISLMIKAYGFAIHRDKNSVCLLSQITNKECNYSKVLDECRYTTSGLIGGKNPVGGPGIELPDERPESYPASINGTT